MKTLIKNANIVNEGKVFQGDVLINDQRVQAIGGELSAAGVARIIEADGKYLLPGVIDDQVHFREPGLTHKGNIYSESRAAVAGGVTSYMEMPNTSPPTFTQALLEEKYTIASRTSLANYSFYIGASNDNVEEVLKTDLERVCGLKIFMGSSTGNLLVDNPATLEAFFSRFPGLIATHCEDEKTVRRNTEMAVERFGDNIPVEYHPVIRNEEACYLSSSMAVALAKKWGTHLHVLHISTAKETALFSNDTPLEKKKITAEACIHHLWFEENDYKRLGTRIKWNPAVKTAADRDAILKAVVDDRIDVIATDHAPHTLQEKSNPYLKAPSGGPLIQHSLQAMLDIVPDGRLGIADVVRKMCHNPAVLYRIRERGFIREGYFADLVLVDTQRPFPVAPSNILAKCGWSPFEGHTFRSTVTHTFVSGHLAWKDGEIDESTMGKRLAFNRQKD